MEVGGGVRGTFSDVEPLVASHQLVGVTMEMDRRRQTMVTAGMGGRAAGKWAREELLRSRASIASASAAPPPASRLSGVRTALPGRTLHRSERIH